MHTTAPDDLKRSKVKTTDRADPVIDDFSHEWPDWYSLSGNNPHHREY